MEDELDFDLQNCNEDYVEIESQIRKRIDFLGITMKVLIAKIGMTEQGFYKMLKNKSLKVITLIKISWVLNVPISYFFGGSASYKSPESENKRLKEKVNNLIENDKNKDKHINELYERLNEKDKIIKLLEWKIENLNSK